MSGLQNTARLRLPPFIVRLPVNLKRAPRGAVFVGHWFGFHRPSPPACGRVLNTAYPRVQLGPSAAALRTWLRDGGRGGRATKQRSGSRLAVHPIQPGRTGTASSSHFRLDKTVVHRRLLAIVVHRHARASHRALHKTVCWTLPD